MEPSRYEYGADSFETYSQLEVIPLYLTKVKKQKIDKILVLTTKKTIDSKTSVPKFQYKNSTAVKLDETEKLSAFDFFWLN